MQAEKAFRARMKELLAELNAFNAENYVKGVIQRYFEDHIFFRLHLILGKRDEKRQYPVGDFKCYLGETECWQSKKEKEK